jgi:hypothetical protein
MNRKTFLHSGSADVNKKMKNAATIVLANDMA